MQIYSTAHFITQNVMSALSYLAGNYRGKIRSTLRAAKIQEPRKRIFSTYDILRQANIFKLFASMDRKQLSKFDGWQSGLNRSTLLRYFPEVFHHSRGVRQVPEESSSGMSASQKPQESKLEESPSASTHRHRRRHRRRRRRCRRRRQHY